VLQPGRLKIDKCPYSESQLVQIEQGPVAFDKSEVFQLLDTVRYGRGRQSDAPAYLYGGKPGVFLQFFQNMTIEVIKHFII